jgi:hypothetical protein
MDNLKIPVELKNNKKIKINNNKPINDYLCLFNTEVKCHSLMSYHYLIILFVFCLIYFFYH